MKIKKLLYVLSAVLILGSVAFFGHALANTNNEKDEDRGNSEQAKEAQKRGSTFEVHISNKGKVNVQGAKVTAISGNTINASTSWNLVSLNWAVNVLPETRFIRRFGSKSALTEVSVGDIIGFQGNLVNTATSPIAVNATIIKDWSIQKKNASFSKTATLNLNDRTTFSDGLSVMLKEINDSRCLENVQCISAGEISGIFALSGGKLSASKEIRLGTVNNKSVSLEGYTFYLKNATKTSITIKVEKK